MADNSRKAPKPNAAAIPTAANSSFTPSSECANDMSQQASANMKARIYQGGSRLRTKAERARTPLLVLIASLAYICTMFTTMSIGLQEISGNLKPKLADAKLALRAESSLLYRETFLQTRLDKLLDSRMSRSFMESLDDCLTRGLQEANVELIGLGFQYPHIRNATINWVEDNCHRLHFTPQVSNPTTHQAVMTQWARTTYRTRNIVEGTLSIIKQRALVAKQRADLIWNRFFGKTITESVVPEQQTANSVKQHITQPPLAKMPFGFGVVCGETGLICRITYPRTAGQPPDKATISHESIARKKHTVKEVSNYLVKSAVFRQLMHALALYSVLPEVLLIAAYLFAGICAEERTSTHIRDRKASEPRFTKEEVYAGGSVALQLVTMLAHIVTENLSGQGDASKCFTGIIMLLLSSSMFIAVLYPNAQVENVVNIHKSIKALYTILQDRDDRTVIPVYLKQTDRGNAIAAIERDGLEEATTAQIDECKRRASAKSSWFRYGASTTTVQQDLQATRDAVRERKTHNAFVESDSDSDVDHDRFIDLAGGITLTTTDGEDGWSVVNA